jgi:hypothetical protein
MGASPVRFTVLAEFDDDTVGDISRHPGLSWRALPPFPAAATVTADGDITAVTPAGMTDVEVTLPADLGGGTATAQVENAPSWATPGAATLVPGSPGVARMADIPNILFLPDGFLDTPAEKARFEGRVKRIVDQLQKYRTTRPFDLLKNSINYFTAFIPSRERGSNVLYDLKFRSRVAGALRTTHVPAPEPPGVGGITKVEHLIHQVGLPVPADSTIPATAAGFATKQAEWLALYNAGHIVGVNLAIFREWKDLHDHTLAFERDAAFGLANGDRPQVQQEDDGRVLSWHPFRTTRADVDQMLALITDGPGGATIGATWSGGKDRALVFVLCAGARDSGSRTRPPDELIAAVLVDDFVVRVQRVAGSNIVRTNPYSVPLRLSPEVRATVAHETAHVLNLDDEYGGRLTITPASIALLVDKGNLQDDISLRNPGPRLNGDEIKWNWPRIGAAGVLVDPPFDELGGRYRIVLQPSHGSQFAISQIVRLRRRPFVNHPDPSPPLEIVDIDPANPDEIIVEFVNPADGPLIVADWPGGSILFLPIFSPEGNELTLVHDDIRAHISANDMPLNRVPPAAGNPPTACAADGDPVQRALNRPAGLANPPRYSAWIIGLYDGGDGFHCGVYHPSGACIMRALRVPLTSATYPGVVYNFCLVCRYILVDNIDPTQHGVIDVDYSLNYPGP